VKTDSPLWAWAIALIALGLCSGSCAKKSSPVSETEYSTKILGHWRGSLGDLKETMSIDPGGIFVCQLHPKGFIANTLSQGVTGTWRITGATINLTITSAENERLENIELLQAPSWRSRGTNSSQNRIKVTPRRLDARALYDSRRSSSAESYQPFMKIKFIERGIMVENGAFVCSTIHDHFSVPQAAEDDHMNLLCLGGRTIGPAVAWDIVEAYLAVTFSQTPRKLRRLDMVGGARRAEQLPPSCCLFIRPTHRLMPQ
jgi:hypothetical protein